MQRVHDPDGASTTLSFETHGIDCIPDEHRSSSLWGFVRVQVGGANSLATAVLGAFPIMLGLSVRQGAMAIVLGVCLGACILAPMTLFGPINGTNNAVSSSAHFGVVGRIVGSFLSLLTAISFFAISVFERRCLSRRGASPWTIRRKQCGLCALLWSDRAGGATDLHLRLSPDVVPGQDYGAGSHRAALRRLCGLVVAFRSAIRRQGSATGHAGVLATVRRGTHDCTGQSHLLRRVPGRLEPLSAAQHSGATTHAGHPRRPTDHV